MMVEMTLEIMMEMTMETIRAPAGPKGRKAPKGPFGPLGQSACFGAGCYIEMATSYH